MHNHVQNRLIAIAASILVSQTLVVDAQSQNGSVSTTAGFKDSEIPLIADSLNEDSGNDVIPTPTRRDSENPPRIGFTDADIIMSLLPQYEAYLQEIQGKYDSDLKIVEERRVEFQARLDSYEEMRPMLSEEARADRERELRQGQQELQDLIQQVETRLEQTRVETLKPVRKMVQEAIEEVAQEKGLDIVVKRSAILYVDSRSVVNISLEVAAKLDITDSETTDQEGN